MQLSIVVQAKEFHDVRLKSYEKKLYKELNGANGIKFPIKVDLAMHAHKRSLILQAELGGVEFPANEQYAKYKRQFSQDKNILFSHIHRLIHCVIDCQIHKQNAVAARHALELARSFSARVWDNSPYQMKQFPQIGLVAIRKLAMGGINSIETLEATEPHRIELLLSKNSPFGQKLLDNLKGFPKLRVSIRLMGKVASKGRPVIVKIKADCGFMNDKVPATFQKKPLYICLLTERSDGHLVDFKRISAKNLNNGRDFLVSVELLNQTQFITCYIMCDAVAGTLRQAELKPQIPAHLFPQPQDQRRQIAATQRDSRSKPNAQVQDSVTTSPATLEDDEFDENEIEDQDMVDAVTGLEFHDIDNIKAGPHGQKLSSDSQHRRANPEESSWNPEKLENGKWACNHKCKDKTGCKHLCCREGVDKAPKPPKSAFVSAASLVDVSSITKRKDKDTQKLPAKKPTSSHISTKAQPADIETLNLFEEPSSGGRNKKAPRELKSLDRLHNSVVREPAAPVMAQKRPSRNSTMESWLTSPLSNRDVHAANSSDIPSTEYGGDWMANLPSPSALLEDDHNAKKPQLCTSVGGGQTDFSLSPALPRQDTAAIKDDLDNDSLEDFDLSQFDGGNDDEKSDIEAALIGFSDSVAMNEDSQHQAAPNDSRRGKSNANDLPWRENDVAADNYVPTGNDHIASSKLFVSTDSPEKQMDLPEKRTRSVSAEARDLSRSPPALKRLKTSSQAEPALRPSTSAADQAATSAPVIKPGQPAWVYDFDPSFIAEWQDFVDFV